MPGSPQDEEMRRKKGRKPKPVKPPKEKKAREPKPTRPPKAKKPKPPKGPRKPLFSFGKKKKEAPTMPSEVPIPPGLTPAEAPELPKEKKPLFGKRARKKPREKKEKKQKAAKAPKEKRAKVPKEKKAKAPKEKKVRARGGAGKRSPVGLDLGRTSITAVQLRYQAAGAALMAAAVDQLPEGLIQEGEVRDVDALSFAIKDFWKSHKIKGRNVELGLANQKVVVRALEFPILEEKELRSAIEFQAQDYIPIPIEEAVIDYHVLGRFTGEDGIEKQKVLVVAAQKVMVMDFINAIKKARLRVAGIDLQAFAMLRSLTPKSMLEMELEGAVAIANIASDVTNLVVELAGEPQFTRIVPFGGDDFTRAVQDLKGISFAEADALKMETSLSAPGGPPQPTQGQPPEGKGEEGQPPEGGVEKVQSPEGGNEEVAPPQGEAEGTGSPAQVQRALELAAGDLADEIRRSLDYYQSQESSAPVSRLILSGGGSLLPNLDKYLSQAFPFEVLTGDPLKRITQNRTNLADEELQALAPRLAIAIGLALENED